MNNFLPISREISKVKVLLRIEETVQLHSESQVHVVIDSGVQTERLEEMEEVHCVREEVEAFYKACNLPNAPDVDEFGDDEGFEDDEFLFYE